MSRKLWLVALVLCGLIVTAGGVYAYRLSGDGARVVPLLLVVPAAIVARAAWRHLRGPA